MNRSRSRPLVSFPDDDFLREANEPGHIAPEDLSEHLVHTLSPNVDAQVTKHLSTCAGCRKLAAVLSPHEIASRTASDSLAAQTELSATFAVYEDTSSIPRHVEAFGFDDAWQSDSEPPRLTFPERVDEIIGWLQGGFRGSAPLPNMGSEMPNPELPHNAQTADYPDAGEHSDGTHDLNGAEHNTHDTH